MEENKFEKQVKQQMDELAIQPGDAVWKKIETRIEKKKNRKWGLIILFLLIGIALPGGYWLWNTRQHKLSADNNSKKVNNKTDDFNKSLKENGEHENNSVTLLLNKKNDAVVIMKGKEGDKQSQLLNNANATTQLKSNKKSYTSNEKKKKVAGKIYFNTTAATVAEEALPNSSVNENINDELKDSIDKKINNDSLVTMPVSKTITKKDNDTTVQQQTIQTNKQSHNNKWKFGILIDGGISGIGNGFLSLNSLPVYAIAGSLNSGQQSGTLSSITKPGFGFVAGVFAEKIISKKIKLISGFNYKSFTTSIELNDSSGIYRAITSNNKYINHFNFIEIPLSLQIQIGKGTHAPLLWQSGIAIAELISSDALQLNYSNGYYYKNNSLLNKTQIGFNTSLLVSLFSKHNHSLLIGPYFYYDASPVAHKGLYNQKHFVFTALHAAINFSK